MKKLKYMFVAAMAIAAIAATIFVGCKKEKDESQAQLENTETQDLRAQIEAFQSLRESVHSGNKADGVMTIEEMRYYLDITVNYEHSQHMIPCGGAILDTLYLAMPCVDNEGNVTIADVVATYESLDKDIVNHMEMVRDGKDIPSYFSIVMPDETNIEESMLVVFMRGVQIEKKEAKNTQNACEGDGPFVEILDDWLWGDSLGLCKPNPVNSTSDAAQQLSDEFVYVIPAEHQGDGMLLSNVVHVVYRPCVSTIPNVPTTYYVDPNMEDCADTWLFFGFYGLDNDPCIGWDILNCYWRSINRNIACPDAPLHSVPGGRPFVSIPYHQCIIDDYKFLTQDGYVKVHTAHVIYCIVLWDDNPTPPIN